MQIRGSQFSPSPSPLRPSGAPAVPEDANETPPGARKPSSGDESGRDRRLGGTAAELGSVSRPRPPKAWTPWRSNGMGAAPASPEGPSDTSKTPHAGAPSTEGESGRDRRLGGSDTELGSVFRPRPPQHWVPWRSTEDVGSQLDLFS